MSSVFNIPPVSLGNGNFLHIIEIESITDAFAALIDEKIRIVTEGNTDTDISLLKKRLYDFLQGKKNSTIEKGAVAEFMIHIYMNVAGYKQEFIFWNLEERSIKKGFDGYYTINNEEWILESKSGSASVTGNSHISKFSEAYKDLEDKIKDPRGNNPWRNAYTHACHRPVESADDIIKNIKKLAEDFDSGKYKKLENLNIAPASTLFLEGTWTQIDQSDLKTKIENSIIGKEFKGINILCINNKSLTLLEEYLNL